MKLRSAVNVVAREFFQVALVTYLILTLAETVKAGFVSNFFNLNYLLIIVLVTGVGMVLTEGTEAEVAPAAPDTATKGGTVRKTSPKNSKKFVKFRG